jgi:hypothetical protein
MLAVTVPGRLTITFPSDRDEDLVRQFKVTLNYLRDLALFLKHTYGGKNKKLYAGIAATVAAHPAYVKIARRPGSTIDFDQLQRHLEIAWVSELELRIPAALGAKRTFRVTNAWAPVHAYYAVSMLLQAWFDGNGMTGTADDHTAALRSISAQIKDRQLFPTPWSVLCEGNPFAKGGCNYIHEPASGACSAKVEVLSTPVSIPGVYSEADFWARFGTWLRTTRKSRLEKREEQWKRKQRKQRIDPNERKKYASSLHPTSLFDCLWRLRIRSNYRSVETYLVRYVGDDDAERFHKALVTVTQATMLLLECYVARVIGAAAYEKMVQDFLSHDPQGLAAQTVGRRLPYVLKAATASGARP